MEKKTEGSSQDSTQVDEITKELISLSLKDSQEPSEKLKESKVPYKGESLSIYIYKVLKQVHPDLGISKKSMAILNSMLNDIMKVIAVNAGVLAKQCNDGVMSSK